MQHHIYQLKVSLLGIRPTVWRRILVSPNITLEDLHEVIQYSMGWECSHLYDFEYQGRYIINPGNSVILNNLELQEDDEFYYTYDYCDNWKHIIHLEKVLSNNQEAITPLCIDGEGACPPEESGGAWGYEAKLDIFSNKKHPNYQETIEVLGKNFDPQAFNIHSANKKLRLLDDIKQHAMR